MEVKESVALEKK